MATSAYHKHHRELNYTCNVEIQLKNILHYQLSAFNWCVSGNRSLFGLEQPKNVHITSGEREKRETEEKP